jgi:protein gp37
MSDIRKSIVWADWSWNPVWGCLNKCPYCYARNIAKRFGKQVCGRDDFVPTWIEKNFQKPIPKYATHIFVNSMSDVAFWSQEWFDMVIEKTGEYPDKKFLFLTKDIEKFIDLYCNCDFNEMAEKNKNTFIGSTVTTNNIDKKIMRFAQFISIEPILEKIDIDKISLIEDLEQIIVGSETGNRKGKIIPKAEWIEEIRGFCQSNGIKLFEKDSLKDIVKRDLIQERI